MQDFETNNNKISGGRIVNQIQSYDLLDNEKYAGCFELRQRMLKHRNKVLRQCKIYKSETMQTVLYPEFVW